MNGTILAPLGMAVVVVRKDYEKALREALDRSGVALLRLDIGGNLPASVVSRYANILAQFAVIDVSAIGDVDGLSHALTAVRMLNDGLRVILLCEPDMPTGCAFASAAVSCGIYDLIQTDSGAFPADALMAALRTPATFGDAARWLVRGSFARPEMPAPDDPTSGDPGFDEPDGVPIQSTETS